SPVDIQTAIEQTLPRHVGVSLRGRSAAYPLKTLVRDLSSTDAARSAAAVRRLTAMEGMYTSLAGMQARTAVAWTAFGAANARSADLLKRLARNAIPLPISFVVFRIGASVTGDSVVFARRGAGTLLTEPPYVNSDVDAA